MPNDLETTTGGGQPNVFSATRTADRAILLIETHMEACDKRQINIEKNQEDTKAKIEKVDTKLSESSSILHNKIDTVGKDVSEKISAIHEKISKVNNKLAMIIGGLLVVQTFVELYTHFAGK